MAALRLSLALTLAALLAGACFSPRQPGCAFSCVADGRCPAGYSCEPDGLCHRDDGVGSCDFKPQDAGRDGAADAENDTAADVAED